MRACCVLAVCLLRACCVLAACLLRACCVLGRCLVGACCVLGTCLLGACCMIAACLLPACCVLASCLLHACLLAEHVACRHAQRVVGPINQGTTAKRLHHCLSLAFAFGTLNGLVFIKRLLKQTLRTTRYLRQPQTNRRQPVTQKLGSFIPI